MANDRLLQLKWFAQLIGRLNNNNDSDSLKDLIDYPHIPSSFPNFFNSTSDQENKTILDMTATTTLYGEVVAGVLLLTCGALAALANALVLCISLKHLKSRNVLFIIITNFALIDEFKALCAIYMALTFFLSGTGPTNNINNEANGEILFYKLLQLSLFVFYFCNICSVLNLILAVINELLYIKLPLQYAKVVNKWRVFMAVIVIWLVSLSFSLLKNLHSGGDVATRVWVLNSWDNATVRGINASHSGNLLPSDRHILRPSGGSTAFGDIYALILAAIMITCLFIVAATYLSLYCTVRHAFIYRQGNDILKMSNSFSRILQPDTSNRSSNDSAISMRKIKVSHLAWFTKDKCMNSNGSSPNEVVQSKKRTAFSSTIPSKGSLTSDDLRHSRNTTPERCAICPSIEPSTQPLTTRFTAPNKVSKPSLINSKSLSIEKQDMSLYHDRQSCYSGQSTPGNTLRNRLHRNSRLLRRHKCIIVILTVCCLYLVYLSLYFSLKLIHIIHIVHGINPRKVCERYIIQLILRSMFVLQASLNPLIFFRIKTFRLSFIRFYYDIICCKKQMPINYNRPSMVEFSMPVYES